MKTRNRLGLCLMTLTAVACWIHFAAAAPGGDESGEKTSDRFKVTVKVNMVNVPVTVRRKEGGFVKGLPQEAFRIYEDGVPQEISIFAQEGLPTHIAIVLDISGSVNTAWGTIRYATQRFVEHLHPDDRFSLYTFNTHEAKHRFCGHCGIHPFHQLRSNPDNYGVSADYLPLHL